MALTWRNVAAPNLSGAAVAQASANRAQGDAFDRIAGAFTGRADYLNEREAVAKKDARNALQDQLTNQQISSGLFAADNRQGDLDRQIATHDQNLLKGTAAINASNASAANNYLNTRLKKEEDVRNTAQRELFSKYVSPDGTMTPENEVLYNEEGISLGVDTFNKNKSGIRDATGATALSNSAADTLAHERALEIKNAGNKSDDLTDFISSIKNAQENTTFGFNQTEDITRRLYQHRIKLKQKYPDASNQEITNALRAGYDPRSEKFSTRIMSNAFKNLK